LQEAPFLRDHELVEFVPDLSLSEADLFVALPVSAWCSNSCPPLSLVRSLAKTNKKLAVDLKFAIEERERGYGPLGIIHLDESIENNL